MSHITKLFGILIGVALVAAQLGDEIAAPADEVFQPADEEFPPEDEVFPPTAQETPAPTDGNMTPDANTTPEPTDGHTTPEPTDGHTTPEPTDANTTPEPTDGHTTPEPTDGYMTPEPVDGGMTPIPAEEGDIPIAVDPPANEDVPSEEEAPADNRSPMDGSEAPQDEPMDGPVDENVLTPVDDLTPTEDSEPMEWSPDAPSTPPPTNVVPVRTVAVASFVLSVELKDTSAAQEMGDALCGAVTANSGMTCQYQRACWGNTCFEASQNQQHRVGYVLAAVEWTVALSLTSLMGGSELNRFLQENAEAMVKNTGVNASFVGVSAEVRGTFTSTEAPPVPTRTPDTTSPATSVPRTPAPDTVSPTKAPVTGKGLELDFTLPDSVLPTRSQVLVAGVQMVTILWRAIDSQLVQFRGACGAAACYYPDVAGHRLLAVQQSTGTWTFFFDIDTDVSNDEISRLVVENSVDLVNAFNTDAVFVGSRPEGGSDGDSGLPAGAIAGIVVGCIAICAAAIAAVVFVVLRFRNRIDTQVQQQHEV